MKRLCFSLVLITAFFYLSSLTALEDASSDEHVGEESSVVEGEVDSEEEDEQAGVISLEQQVDTVEKIAREKGELDEDIERIFQFMREFIRSDDLPSQTPAKIRIGRSLKVLEGLIPQVTGTSTTWEDTEDATDVFATVIVGLAQFHNLSDAGVEKLSSSIDKFIDLGTNSEYERDRVEWSTYFYFFSLVLPYTEFLRRDLSALDQDRDELFQVRAKLRTEDPKTSTRQIDKFVSCVDSIHKKADKEFTKLFSRLTKALDKTVAAIDKAQSIDNEVLKQQKIFRAIDQNFVKQASGSKILHLVNKIRFDECLRKVSMDRIKFNYPQYFGEQDTD